MSIDNYFGDWKKVINLNDADSLIKKLIKQNKKICPLIKDIFKAFKLCSFNNLRAVVIGQDPYNNYKNGKPVATGLAFANTIDTDEQNYSPSLEVLKESVIDYTKPHRSIIFDPSLEKWEEQGVLMLNTALSCEVGKPGSHSLLWRPFIKSLLINLSKCHTGIVYILMGNDAQSFESYINKKFNHIIKVRHPSWYARQKTRMPSDVWKQVNDILIGQNGYGIEWYKEY